MKRWISGVVLAAVVTRGAVTPQDVLDAVDRMTPEQVVELYQKLDARLWRPIPAGFFTRLGADVALSATSIDSVDLPALRLSAGDLDLEQAGGADFGLLWRVSAQRLRVGLRLSSIAARDSDLEATGYSRAELAAGAVALAINHQWIRTAHWLVWTEAAPGWAAVRLETIDTPAGGPTTLREFDGAYAQLVLQAGVALRFNPALALSLAAGYRFCDSVELEEGGRKSGLELDASGWVTRLGLAVNF